MITRKAGTMVVAAGLVLALAAGAARAEEDRPLVQIAILLDTSGSMSGLINQAKTQLWQIVNQFALAKKNGKQPLLQVALYEYGKSRLSSKSGWIRKIQPLTDDLDKISQELFALTTNGSQEYCGMVIQKAVRELKWNASPEVYKVIFIAGNEPFTQGPVDYRVSCKEAITDGIIVNTIHCAGGSDAGWKDGALVADGSFVSINHNRAVVRIDAPQDKEIASLNAGLNGTYLAYGHEGKKRKELQEEQDTNAVSAGGSVAQRAHSKAQGYYRNDSWDLVDAVKNDTVKLEEVAEKDLPAEMQKMSEEERVKYVEENAAERSKIQKRINDLAAERKEYVAEEMKKQAGEDTSLGSAVMKIVQVQAEKADFQFE